MKKLHKCEFSVFHFLFLRNFSSLEDFEIFLLFQFCKLRCEYPLWCGDWLHHPSLHSNGNWRKYEVEIHKEKLRKSKWKSGCLHLFPEWKLFSFPIVLISFERKHWRKGNWKSTFETCSILREYKDKIASPLDGFGYKILQFETHKNTSDLINKFEQMHLIQREEWQKNYIL